MATPAPAFQGATQYVTIDPSKPTKDAVANPNPFKISKNEHQQVKWETTDGSDFTIEFKNESPFHYKQFSSKNPYSGEARRDVKGDPQKVYSYSVTLANGQTVDPGGIVDK